jgi:hypothetical protein
MGSMRVGRRRQLYLHVGAPKSGTTYLQERLRANAGALRGHGVLVPRTPWWSGAGDLHFRAALDLTGKDFGGPRGHAEGAWGQLVRQVRRYRGTSIVSHELFATAESDAIARLHAELPDVDLHVVFTARDPARALPAAWQETVKLGRSIDFRRFLRNARAGQVWFAEALDVAGVLGAWGAHLPADRLHLVVVPATAGDPDLLWRRFSDAVDIDPGWAPHLPERRNESLGVAETQLLRHVNRRFGRRGQRHHRTHQLLKNVVAEGALAARDSERIELPPGEYDWVAGLADGWIDWVREHGVDVHGDLDELRPVRPDDTARWVDPDDAPPREVTGAALDALAAALAEAARREDPGERPVARILRRLRRR